MLPPIYDEFLVRPARLRAFLCRVVEFYECHFRTLDQCCRRGTASVATALRHLASLSSAQVIRCTILRTEVNQFPSRRSPMYTGAARPTPG